PEHTHFAGPREVSSDVTLTLCGGRGGGHLVSGRGHACAVEDYGQALALAESGRFDVVEAVEHIPLAAPVYDIDVEGTHNYIANGLLTHNSIYRFRGAD